MADAPSHRLGGRYEVRSLIGRGGMAEVHLGFDTRLSRVVAIKMLRIDLAKDSVFQARFRREAQAAASLNHPNIVAVYDTGEDMVTGPDGMGVSVPYIVMEYVEGHTVKELLSDGTPVPIDEAVEIVAGVLSALEYSHARGLVHRDIKPGNIMLTNDGKVKVMDFGIARALTDSQATMTQTNQVVGTAQYLSPEQARGEQVDARSDLYSTGVVLFELLTGQPPFHGDSAVAVAYQHVSQVPPAPSTITPDIPEALDRVCMKALAKNKEDRYASASDMRADLIRAARGDAVNAPATQVWAAAAGAGVGAAAADDDATRTLAVPPPPVYTGPTRTTAGSGAGATATFPATGAAAGAGRAGTAVAEDEEQPKKKRTGMIVGLVLLALALIVGGALGINALLNKGQDADVVTVPTDLVGKTVAEVKTELDALGLKYTIAPEKKASEDYAADLVIETDPKGGTEAKKGDVITLTQSSGPMLIKVPNVVGMTQEQAKDALEKVGLVLGGTSTEDSPDQPKDKVLSTDPNVDTDVKKGQQVKLVLSSGNVTIPTGLVGQPSADVRTKLQALKLNVNETQAADDTVPAGSVISLNPGEGALAKQGDAVSITVSTGPAEVDVAVPSVTGQDLNNAKLTLQNAGLEVGSVTEDFHATIPVNQVISSDPASGATVKKGSTVNLVLSKGPQGANSGSNSGGTDNGGTNSNSNSNSNANNTTGDGADNG